MCWGGRGASCRVAGGFLGFSLLLQMYVEGGIFCG